MSNGSDHFCVFEVGQEFFAVSAQHIREVTATPDFARVPCRSEALAGLWHEGSEFVPVLRVPLGDLKPGRESQILVIHATSRWALLVDQVHCIHPIECSQGSATADGTAVMGMSTWNDHSVRVLNLEAIYRLVEATLEQDVTQHFAAVS